MKYDLLELGSIGLEDNSSEDRQITVNKTYATHTTQRARAVRILTEVAEDFQKNTLLGFKVNQGHRICHQL